MPQVDLIQTNFAGGEVSDLIKARSDVQKYANSMERMENFIPLEQGGALARSGTAHIDETYDSSTKTRLVPFEYSTLQAHVLEFTTDKFRVITDEARTTLNAGSHPLGYVATNYDDADVAALRWTQSADTLYSVNGGVSSSDPTNIATKAAPNTGAKPPKKITRDSADGGLWTVSDINLLDGPYFPENTDASITLTFASDPATTTTQNVTASAPVFVATDSNGTSGTGVTNRHIRFRDKNDLIQWATITDFVSTTVATITFQNTIDGFMHEEGDPVNPFEADQIEHRWRLGSFSTTSGFPARVGFHDRRLVFARTSAQPDTFWMSKSSDFELFSPTEYDLINAGVLDDNAIYYSLDAGGVDAIEWMVSASAFYVGTTGAEWLIRATSRGESVTPENVHAVRQTFYGGADVTAIAVRNSVFYVQRTGRKLMEFFFDVQSDYDSIDRTILHPSVLRDGTAAVDMTYQQFPGSQVHVVRDDGQIASLTFNKSQELFAWSRMLIGGSFGTTTHGVIESAAVVPSADGRGETLYLVVKRTINGVTKRHNEFLKADFYPSSPTDHDDMWFMDSAVSFENTAFTAGAVVSGTWYRVTVVGTGMDLSGVGGPASPAIKDTFKALFTALTSGTVTSGTRYRVTSAGGGSMNLANVGGNNPALIDEEFTATSTAVPTDYDSGTLTPVPIYGTGGTLIKIQNTFPTTLTHLEGETLDVLGDNSVQDQVTVASGAVTFSKRHARAVVGLPYTPDMVILPLNQGNPRGTAQGRKKRIDHVGVRRLNSIGGTITAINDGVEQEEQPMQEVRAAMNNTPALQSNYKEATIQMAHDEDAQVRIRQTQPYPLTVTSLVFEARVTE
jgi:hypothetical protein